MSKIARYELRIDTEGAGLYATEEPNTQGMQYVSALDYESMKNELLEVLERVESLCRPSGYVGVNGQYLKTIRSAIAKARGEQS